MVRYSREYGVRGRIIGLRQLNPANAPDAWEKEQLEIFTRLEKKEVWQVTNIDGKPYLRYLRVMMMEPGCDKCHSILGYKTGDVRGATGLNLPLEKYFNHIASSQLILGLTHGSIWLICLLGLGVARHSAILQDTKRRKAEILVRETSARHQAMIQTANDAILTADQFGNIVGWNKAAEILFGYTQSEILQQPLTRLMPEKYRAQHEAGMNRVRAGQTPKVIGKSIELVGLRKDESEFPMDVSLAQWETSEGQFFSGTIRDITSIKAHKKQLEHIAHYDTLTQLPNRVLLADRLHQAMAQAKRHDLSLAVAYLDLDGFKPINDTHGHNIGDELLVTIAKRMKLAMRAEDTLARIGGDEFIAILVELKDTNDDEMVLERLLQAASDPVTVNDVIMRVSASIGVTRYPQDNSDADLLIRHADQAMYNAKQAGKNRYNFFDIDHDSELMAKHESQERIRKAIDQNEFELFYQPKVNMVTGDIVGAEALIRWMHPERGLLSPAEFLPIIENHIISVELGEWVINQALDQLNEWNDVGLNIPVSVNVGARQLQSINFENSLKVALSKHPRVLFGQLELEVLETSALEDVAQVSDIMRNCRELGVDFSLDDFGTGYSSLTYLKRLPVGLLKIDQSFVRDMLDDVDDLAIVKGVIGLANAFKLEVIAEGVETIEHGSKLLDMGCQLAQGYGIARPMPANNIPDWVSNWKPDPTWSRTSD